MWSNPIIYCIWSVWFYLLHCEKALYGTGMVISHITLECMWDSFVLSNRFDILSSCKMFKLYFLSGGRQWLFLHLLDLPPLPTFWSHTFWRCISQSTIHTCPNGHRGLICKFPGKNFEVCHGMYYGCWSSRQDWWILTERLLVKVIPAVTISIKDEQKYHGKMKTLNDSLTGAVKLV